MAARTGPAGLPLDRPLILHGDSDQTVPFEVSGARAHQAIAGSQLHLIKGGPHGCHLSHAQEFNQALLDFLQAG